MTKTQKIRKYPEKDWKSQKIYMKPKNILLDNAN